LRFSSYCARGAGGQELTRRLYQHGALAPIFGNGTLSYGGGRMR
jgi:hypothetical protein